MSRALFWTTLRLSRWAVVAWAVFLVLYGVLVVSLFSSLDTVSGYAELIASMPEGIRASVGLTEDLMSFYLTDSGIAFGGYITTEYLAWWPVIAGIYAVTFCSGAVARETDNGTMELLLSHPIPRYKVVASKFVAFLMIVLVLMLFSAAGIAGGLLTGDQELDMGRLLLVTLQAGLAVTTIAAYSMLLSCLLLDPRKAMTLAGGLTAALYVVSLLGPLLHSWAWVQKLSLFYYYRPLEVMLKGSFSISSLVVYLGITVVCFVAALVVFQRRKTVV